MIKFKEIRLCPTHHILDVWITDTPDSLNNIFMKRYGMTDKELENEPINSNECMLLYSDKESDLQSEKRFVMILENNKDVQIIIHEITHLKYQLSGETGIEITKDSQEWQAYFMDYIAEQILKDDYNTQS